MEPTLCRSAWRLPCPSTMDRSELTIQEKKPVYVHPPSTTTPTDPKSGDQRPRPGPPRKWLFGHERVFSGVRPRSEGWGAASAGLASRCDAPVAGVPGTRFLVALSVLTLLLNPSSPFPILHNKLLAPAPPHPHTHVSPPRQPNLPPRQLLEGHPRRPFRGHGGGGVRTVREEDGVPRP